MRDSYAADIGDFRKYALLNALAGSDLRLGVLWCRNAEPNATQDGGFTAYQELRSCDPDLYDRLAQILKNKQRTLSQVEVNGTCPETLFSTAPQFLLRRCHASALLHAKRKPG